MMKKFLLLSCSILSVNCADQDQPWEQHDQRWELIEWKKVMRELQPELLVPVIAVANRESLTVQEISHLNAILLKGNEVDIVECITKAYKAYNDKNALMAKPRHAFVENPKLAKLAELRARAFVAMAHQRGDHYNNIIHNALEAFFLQHLERPLTFHEAILFNSTYYVEKILQDPAREEDVQDTAYSALNSAVAYNSPAVALLLLNKGFEPNSFHVSIVQLAIETCEYNDAAYELLEALLNADALDRTNLGDSYRCLYTACKLNLPKAVTLLLQHGISPNISLQRETFLHAAKTREIGELLVHYGADMHLLTKKCTYGNNYTPLEETVASFKVEYIPYVQFLLEHGAQKERAIKLANAALLKTYKELEETMVNGTKEALVACTKKYAGYQQLLPMLAADVIGTVLYFY